MFGSAFTIVRLWGIPIKLHFTFLLALPFLAFYYGVFMALGVFVSIVLHELGHSLVAIRKGCHVREILLLPIGGAARMDHMPFKPVDEILMALAGPAVSLLLFGLLVFGGAYLPLPREPSILSRGGWISLNDVQILGFVNLALACFNLLPSFPMDGGRVVRALLMFRLGRLRATLIAARLGQTIAVAGAIYALGHFTTHFMWLIVATFIVWAAESELRMVRREEAILRRQAEWFTTPVPPPARSDGDQVIIMPPPYRREPAVTRPIEPLE